MVVCSTRRVVGDRTPAGLKRDRQRSDNNTAGIRRPPRHNQPKRKHKRRLLDKDDMDDSGEERDVADSEGTNDGVDDAMVRVLGRRMAWYDVLRSV